MEAPKPQPANELILIAFSLVQTQMTYAGFGEPVGLSYPAVELRLSKTAWYKQMDEDVEEIFWSGLTMFEREYLKANRERAKRERDSK